MPDTRAEFDRRLNSIMPGLARAFRDSVRDVRSAAQMRALEAAIDRGDIEAAFQALRLGPAFFAPLDMQIQQAFTSGAMWQATLSQAAARRAGGGMVVRFNGRHPKAEAWSRNRAAGLVTEILDDTRSMVRETITEGLEGNRNTRQVMRDLVGRRVGRQRRGGLVGLHSRQATYVRNMRAALADPERVGEYLTDRWSRRDRSPRYMGAVRRALAEGRALRQTEIDEMAERYSDRLLDLRGQTIARTEAVASLNAGREEMTRQLVEGGDVPASAVKMVWRSTRGKDTRDSHAAMDGQEVPFGQPFVSPETGAAMMFPGDTSLGAPGEETINCRCAAQQRIDYVEVARARGTY